MTKFLQGLLLLTFAFTLAACEQLGALKIMGAVPASFSSPSNNKIPGELRPTLDLGEFVTGSRSKVDLDAGFVKALTQAVDQDPAVNEAKNDAAASMAKVRITETGRDTQINASVLGGIEDVTDETVGVAAILKANRMLYDGGMLNAKIDADTYFSKAENQVYLLRRSESALELSHAWIELERFQSLTDLINRRLSVLDPLLLQLEKVATSGLGDVSQVASAQRIVSSILVAEADVAAKYQQAKITFVNGFGRLPGKASYDSAWISKAVPTSTSKALVEHSPGLLAPYWAYRAAEASVVAVKAQDNFNIGLSAKLQRPFGSSGANSDESVGFVLTKKLYRGDQLSSQISNAEATVRARAAQVLAGYRESELTILGARETIKSLDIAIKLARKNAASSREEIDYLRKQLIIGGSTLESVLSAEARLYSAESKEIGFIADRRKAEVAILAITGIFSKALKPN